MLHALSVPLCVSVTVHIKNKSSKNFYFLLQPALMQPGGSSSTERTPIVRANYRARCAGAAVAQQSISSAISNPGLPPTSPSPPLHCKCFSCKIYRF